MFEAEHKLNSFNFFAPVTYVSKLIGSITASIRSASYQDGYIFPQRRRWRSMTVFRLKAPTLGIMENNPDGVMEVCRPELMLPACTWGGWNLLGFDLFTSLASPHVAVHLFQPSSNELWNSTMIENLSFRWLRTSKLYLILFSRSCPSRKLFDHRITDTVTYSTVGCSIRNPLRTYRLRWITGTVYYMYKSVTVSWICVFKYIPLS